MAHNRAMQRAELGDTVRIARTVDTIASGHADREGTCYGFTTPSVTGVTVIGDRGNDDALNVGFEDDTSAWFDASLVVFLDINPGQIARVGNTTFVREPSGQWVERPESD